MPMDIEITEVPEQDRVILGHLAQFYLYDLSEFMGWDVDKEGRFGDILEGCWSEPWRHPFLIRVDGRIAGFAIVDERSQLTGDMETRDMREFFILRKYRGSGVGRSASAYLFDRFPGRWEVRELAKNVAAHAFWRAAIGRYTHGRFEEVEVQRGPVQSFDTTDRIRRSEA